MNRRVFLGATALTAAGLSTLSHAAEPAAGSVKILGLAGSMRKGKSTYKAVELALESARTVSPAITTELIELSGLNFDPYIAVGSKRSDQPDDFPALREKLEAPNDEGRREPEYSPWRRQTCCRDRVAHGGIRQVAVGASASS